MDDNRNQGWTALHRAVESGNVDLVREILSDLKAPTDCNFVNSNQKFTTQDCWRKSYAEDLFASDVDGKTPLHIAVIYGNVDIVKLFSDLEINESRRDNRGRTPLHWACLTGHLEIVKLLIKINNAVLNAQCIDGCTPLTCAVLTGSIEIVKVLLNEGADCKISDKDGRSPLYFAVQKGSLETIRCLLECNECDINQRDNDGATPLYCSCFLGYVSIAKLLVSKRARCDLTNKNGNSPLHVAVKEANTELVKCLVNSETFIEDANILNADGASPIHLAIFTGDAEIMKMVSEKGARPTKDYKSEYRTLFLAVAHEGAEVVKVLVENGACDVNELFMDTTCLMFAAALKNVELVKAVMDVGACCSLVDSYGMNAVHFAAHRSTVEIVRFLLDNSDVDVNSVTNDGRTPLHFAAQVGNVGVIQELLRKGADCNVGAKDVIDGYTPLHFASHIGQFEAAKCLIESGDANVDKQIPDGRSSLHLAASGGYTDIVELLIRNGANCELWSNLESTPLHCAVMFDRLEVVRCLIKLGGVDVNVRTSKGRYPLHHAAFNGNKLIIEALLDAGARRDVIDDYGWTPLRLAFEAKQVHIYNCLMFGEHTAPAL